MVLRHEMRALVSQREYTCTAESGAIAMQGKNLSRLCK